MTKQKSVPQERAVDVPIDLLDLLDVGRLKLSPEVVPEAVTEMVQVLAAEVAPQVL